MDTHKDLWKDVRWSKPIPVFGLNDEEPVAEPKEMQISLQDVLEKFNSGFLRFREIWKQVLHQDLFGKVREIQNLPLEAFEFPNLLWALILYDYATAFRRETVPREACLESLMPLYFGRICSGARITAHMDVRGVEVYVEEQCRIFEETKPWLNVLWR
jgi:hypothetical protein